MANQDTYYSSKNNHTLFCPAYPGFFFNESRKRPKTSRGLRRLFIFYRAVNGYGERYLRPLVSAIILLFISMICCFLPSSGLKLKVDSATRPLEWTSGWDWLESLHYALRTMLLLKPDDLAMPFGYSRIVFILDSVMGPILIGLFALAIRQLLKR